MFISGCPWHLAHGATSHTTNVFSDAIALDIENICINAFY